jgi:hypothetical protein
MESKNIYNAAYRQRMAQAIVIGILSYQKQVSAPPPILPLTNRPAVKNSKANKPRPNKISRKNHPRQAGTI